MNACINIYIATMAANDNENIDNNSSLSIVL